MTAPVAIIAAVARNGVIGHANELLWRLPEDARWFRAQTLGCPVLMGRKTWDSLPERFRPLPGRLNIVITRQPGWQAPGAQAASSLEAALTQAQAMQPEKVFVIGGAEVYAAALPLADELVLTEIDAEFAGDARFPSWNRNAFIESKRERHRAAPPNHFEFSFARYKRR